MKRRNFILACLLLLALPLSAAKVDTSMVKSSSMNKEVQVVVVTPDVASGKQTVERPVFYLSHGYGGHVKTWIQIRPNLPEIIDEKGIIFVCPDGKDSWHWDSPKNLAYRYEAFVSLKLVSYIDRNYKTIADCKGRTVVGLSTEGHGAMWLDICHKDVFGAAGSTSGGVDVHPPSQNWSMDKQLDEMVSNKKVWDEHTVVNQLNKVQNGDLALIIDRDEDNLFLNINKDFHDRLLGRKINHDSITRPGEHNRKCWNNSIDYRILLFSKFFAKRQGTGDKEYPGIINATLLPLYMKPGQVWMGYYFTTS